MKVLLKLLCLALLLAPLAGCKTMQPVSHGEWSNVTSRVEAGDTVEVQTRDGRDLRFTVTEVTDEALRGDGVEVRAEEIGQLKVRAVNTGRTVALGIGSAAIGYVVLSAVAFVLFMGAL